MTVVILMATCNGERYLEQQVLSIRAQTYRDWRLLVRDDASADRTPKILQQLVRDEPRIRVVRDQRGRLGPAGNFACLMEEGLEQQGQVFAFSDQDDIWEPYKLECQLDALQQLQAGRGSQHPILVYSDLALMDDEGVSLGDSFMARQHIRRPAQPLLQTLLMQNHVPGCSMLTNRALLELATPLPHSAHMHDWWLALCAAAAGSTGYLPQPQLRYRLHAGNQVGAAGIAGRLLRPGVWLAWLRKMNRIYRTGFAQADSLRQRLIERLPASGADSPPAGSLQLLDRLLDLSERPRPLRPLGLLQMGVHCQNPMLTSLVYAQSTLLQLPQLTVGCAPPSRGKHRDPGASAPQRSPK